MSVQTRQDARRAAPSGAVRAAPGAAVYCRISRDDRGDELGVRRQEKDCRKLCDERGWTVAGVFADDDISASDYSRKPRPAFDRMMDAVAAGLVDVIVGWDLDRITRRPGEAERMWEQLIAVGDVRVTTTHGDDIDLRTGDGLMVARIKMAVCSEEVRKMSQRIRRKHQELAEDGKPVGLGAAQPFGYQQGGMIIDKKEAAILRRAASDVLAGTPVSSIARRWNEQQVRAPQHRTSTRGWRAESVRALLVSPRPAGLRRHQEDAGVVLYPAAWPAIIDEATHQRLVAMLSVNRGQGRPGPKTLTAGLVRCGNCGANLMRDHKHGRPILSCRSGPGKPGCGGLSIAAELVEAAVVRRVMAHVEERAAAGADRILAQGADSEAAVVAGEIAQARQWGLDLAGQLGRSLGLDRAEKARAITENKARISELEARLAQLADTATAARWDSLAAFQAEFAAADTDTRRALLSRIIDHATVAPYTGKRNDPGRVQVDFRQ